MSKDLISRQAAIDALDGKFNITGRENAETIRDYINSVNKKLRELPSAQPELCEYAVSRQRLLSDLKELVAEWKKYPVMAEQIKGVEAAIGYVELIPSVKPNSKELSETHKALDTISRQAAINALDEYIEEYSFDLEENGYHNPKWCAMQEAKMTIQRLPSAERRGRWVGERLIYPSGIITFIYHCSECGHEERHAYEDTKPSNYCPNCGARMEETP